MPPWDRGRSMCAALRAAGGTDTTTRRTRWTSGAWSASTWASPRAHGAGARRGRATTVCQAQGVADGGEPRRGRGRRRWRARPAGTRLEVVVEPTGPAWLPIAVFFTARGHVVLPGVQSAKAADLRRFLSRHTKTNGIDADTLARLPLFDPAGLQPLRAARRRAGGVGPAGAGQRPAHPAGRDAQAAGSRTWSAAAADDPADRRARAAPTWRCWNARPTRMPWSRLGQAAHRADREDLATTTRASTGPRSGSAAAAAAVELYGDHPAVAFADLAAEIATEVRLLRAVQAELAAHAAEREVAYRWVDPGSSPAPCPASPTSAAPPWSPPSATPPASPPAGSSGPSLGLAPKASETGDTDRKGQPMSKAGSSLLRTTLVRAADNARKLDPQLARIYYLQMVERGKDHLGALCVVAAHLAERFWAVMNRRHALRHLRHRRRTGHTATKPRRSSPSTGPCPPTSAAAGAARRAGKAPQQVLTGHDRSHARGADTRGDLPHRHRPRTAPARQPKPP